MTKNQDQNNAEIARNLNRNAEKCNVKISWKAKGYSVSQCVQNRIAFNLKKSGEPNANLYGQFSVAQSNCDALIYTVYSYGSHFPIASFIENQWYLTDARYSVTTSQHISKVRQGITDEIVVSKEALKYAILTGELPK